MKVTPKIIAEEYEKLFNIFNSYKLNDDELLIKSSVCMELMRDYDIEIFKQVCKQWKENEKRMPTPNQLSFKCRELKKVKNCLTKTFDEKICGYISIREKEGDLFECEKEICNSLTPDYFFKLDGAEIKICSFHRAIYCEQRNIPHKFYSFFEPCSDNKMSYVTAEIFCYKYFHSTEHEKIRMRGFLTQEQSTFIQKIEKSVKKTFLNKSSDVLSDMSDMSSPDVQEGAIRRVLD